MDEILEPQAPIEAPLAPATEPPDFIPESEMVPDTLPPSTADALPADAAPEFIPTSQFVSDEEKYGTTGQMVATAAEGAAEGLIGPVAPWLEKNIMGIPAEDILARAETNPILKGGFEAAGFIAPAALSFGATAAARAGVTGAVAAAEAATAFSKLSQAGVLGQAGKGAVALARTVGITGEISHAAIRGAFEMALMQGGKEITKEILDDPSKGAENALSNIGVSALLGGALGGTVQAAITGVSAGYRAAKGLGQGVVGKTLGMKPGEAVGEKFVSQADKAAMEAGDFVTGVKHTEGVTEAEKTNLFAGLKTQKPNAAEVIGAGERLGVPVPEGMIYGHQGVQRGEDLLLHGAPTLPAMQRQALYGGGYEKTMQQVATAVGEGSQYSKAEIGNVFKEKLTAQIEEQAKPISEIYDLIKQNHEMIPLDETLAPQISKSLAELQELRLSPSSPEGKLASRVVDEIGNLKSVDDVKAYRSILNRSVAPTASAGEKRMVSILSDKLGDLEEQSLLNFAKANIQTPEVQQGIDTLIAARADANAQYSTLMKKVGTLSEQLGKGRVYGPKDAINFIRERLTPEEVTARLFSKRDSEFLKFFAKEFPDEMALMRDYQKGELVRSASATGSLKPSQLFKSINKLEPEIRAALFRPEELQVLKDAQTWLDNLPKSYNPSGTAHTEGVKHFFESPHNAAIANARDYAITKFIKSVGANAELSAPMRIANAAVEGTKTAAKAARDIFEPTSKLSIKGVLQIHERDEARHEFQKRLDSFLDDPEGHVDQISAGGKLPEYSMAFGQTVTRIAANLAAVKPAEKQGSPLDTPQKPSAAAEAKYNRTLDIAMNPLNVMDHLKKGTLQASDVADLNKFYPQWARGQRDNLISAMQEHFSKGGTIPYPVRMSLSLFMGTPLDSTLTPQAMQMMRPMPTEAPPPPGAKVNQSGMNKMGKANKLSMTPNQQAEARRMAQ